MAIRGVVERIDEDYVYILLGEEAVEVKWPRQFLAEATTDDIFRFDISLAIPGDEVRKMKASNLLQVLAESD